LGGDPVFVFLEDVVLADGAVKRFVFADDIDVVVPLGDFV